MRSTQHNHYVKSVWVRFFRPNDGNNNSLDSIPYAKAVTFLVGIWRAGVTFSRSSYLVVRPFDEVAIPKPTRRAPHLLHGNLWCLFLVNNDAVFVQRLRKQFPRLVTNRKKWGFRFYRDALARRSANIPMVVPTDVRQYQAAIRFRKAIAFSVIKTLHGFFHPFLFNRRRCWRQRQIYVDESHKRHAARILFQCLLEKAAYSHRSRLGIDRVFALFVQHARAPTAFSFNRDALPVLACKEFWVLLAPIVNEVNRETTSGK
jgi:hypothetical protein